MITDKQIEAAQSAYRSHISEHGVEGSTEAMRAAIEAATVAWQPIETGGRWVIVRVEDTCDGLMIHPDDAAAHDLLPDVILESRMLTDTTARVFIPAEQGNPAQKKSAEERYKQCFNSSFTDTQGTSGESG